MNARIDPKIVSLDNHQIPSDFDCNDDPLNKFLLKRAKKKHEIKETFVYLAIHEDKVIGYVALATATVKDTQLQRQIPSILIGRLAVQEEYKGRGVGKKLVLWSLTLAQQVSKRVACRYVYADVLEGSKAEGFYNRIGFGIMEGSQEESTDYKGQYFRILYTDLNKFNLPDN